MATETRNIVFCRETLWDDSLRVSTNAIARQFLKDGWKCGWMLPPVSPLDLKPTSDARQKARLEVFKKGGLWHGENVFEFSPFTLFRTTGLWPMNKPWFTRNAFRFTIPSTTKVLEKNGFLPLDYLVIGNLAFASAAWTIPARRVIFHAQDFFSNFSSAQHEFKGIEAKLIEHSDLVLTVSELFRGQIQDRYNLPPEKIHVIEHAADLTIFQGDHPEPEDLAAIPHPRIAMLGTLGTLDQELLIQLARRRSELNFVSVGPRHVGWEAAIDQAGLTNVHFLGPRSYEQLAGYLVNCDVGLAIYRVADVGGRIAGGFYMKIFDYAAAGLPIVVTEMPGYDDVRDFMFSANTLDGFSEALDKALAYTPQQYAKLKDFSINSGSWSARYRQICDLLDQLD